MCWALYLASDKELTRIPWNESTPAFHTEDLAEIDQPVRGKFTLPYVLYVGSHLGCGCGFKAADRDDIEEQKHRNQTVELLAKYLEDVLKDGKNLEMFLCWEDDQAKPITAKKLISPKDFLGVEFPLEEREFANIILKS